MGLDGFNKGNNPSTGEIKNICSTFFYFSL